MTPSPIYGLTVAELRQFVDVLAAFTEDPAFHGHRVAVAIYARLLTRPDVFRTPVEVKGEAWAAALRVERANVVRALNLLVGCGYLVEHPRRDRSTRSPRRFTVALTLAPRDTYKAA